MFRPSTGTGWIEVVVGCMFSGKSEELIRRLDRARLARAKVIAIKPSIDNRYAPGAIASHSGTQFAAVPIGSVEEIPAICADYDVIGIDEAQFLEGVTEIVFDLAGLGKRVIVAGLDLDYRGMPFGPVPNLMATAEVVDKLHAVCVVCGAAATRSQRIAASTEQVLVGSDGVYEARCRKHWSPKPVFANQQPGTED